MQNPNRSLFFVGEGLTCQKGQDILANLQSDPESCALARERFDRLPVDVAAWCECSGAAPSSGSCAFCNRSSEGALVSSTRDREVDLGGNLTVTCEEAELLAPYLGSTSSSACQDPAFLAAIQECCSGVPDAPAPAGGASQSTTPAPTFATSGAARAARTEALVRPSHCISILAAFWLLLSI
jgi:hypothetical protein